MRITHKIATAASSALALFPVPKIPADNFTLPGGGLDNDRIRAALKGEEFTHSSSDNEVVYAVVLEYILNLDISLTKLRMNDPPDVGQAKADARMSARCEERMERGQFAVCRVDIDWKGDGLRIRVNVSNPRDIVGETEALACDFAELAARRARLHLTPAPSARHSDRARRRSGRPLPLRSREDDERLVCGMRTPPAAHREDEREAHELREPSRPVLHAVLSVLRLLQRRPLRPARPSAASGRRRKPEVPEDRGEVMVVTFEIKDVTQLVGQKRVDVKVTGLSAD